MTKKLSYILFLVGCLFLLNACSITKNLTKDQKLLAKNQIHINGKKTNSPELNPYIKPKPNSSFIGFPLRAYIYNLAHKNPDSAFVAWLNKKPKRKERFYKRMSKKQTLRLQKTFTNFHEWLRKSGEQPAIIDSNQIAKTTENLTKYYQQNGWRDVDVQYTILPKTDKKVITNYQIETHSPYTIDSISFNIQSKTVDSIYKQHLTASFIQLNQQYSDLLLVNERQRINQLMRNSGLYTFEKESVSYVAAYDSIKKTMWIELNIKDKIEKLDFGESRQIPYQAFKISEVNVFNDFNYENQGKAITDSTTLQGVNFYSFNESKFKPKALINAINITPNSIYRDTDKTKTLTLLNNLRTFKYPNIKYSYDTRDSTNSSLIANILLTPQKKFGLDFSADAIHNNIQNVGFAFSSSILARNVFKGAENLEFALRGSIGASKDAADSSDDFFDIREVGANLRLSFPRIFFPINTKKVIPSYMNPSTRINLGASSQTNIGLDKRTFTGNFNYQWFPNKKTTMRFDLFNAQFVRNVNPNNYYAVYSSSYQTLNTIANNSGYTVGNLSIPTQANQFVLDVLNGNLPPAVANEISEKDIRDISNIEERRLRLTENNLILGSSFSFIRNTRVNLLDNQFSRLGAKIELAGNSLSTLSDWLGLQKNSNDRYEIFNVEYSQFIKTELDYIKYWELPNDNVFAVRSFFGIAIPFGNSNSIPFAKSFFAGGANDNRAWKAYGLGPGVSGSFFEFNEANLKLNFNAEYRFTILGDLKGALFADAGNIWNVLDNIEDEDYNFSSLSDLKEIAIGSGLGLRYDFSFFILRLDTGFKTYEPYLDQNQWFTNYNLKHAVYNLGINYPF